MRLSNGIDWDSDIDCDCSPTEDVCPSEKSVIFRFVPGRLKMRGFAGLFFVSLGLACLIALQMHRNLADAEMLSKAALAAFLSLGLGSTGLVPVVGLWYRRPEILLSDEEMIVAGHSHRPELVLPLNRIAEVNVVKQELRTCVGLRLHRPLSRQTTLPLGTPGATVSRMLCGYDVVLDDLWDARPEEIVAWIHVAIPRARREN